MEDDPFFSILLRGGVRFYDSGETWEEGYSDYSDGDEPAEDSDHDYEGADTVSVEGDDSEVPLQHESGVGFEDLL